MGLGITADPGSIGVGLMPASIEEGLTVRAIAMTDFDSGISLRELPTPEPSSNDLLVRVHSSSINGIDVGVASGHLKMMRKYEFPVVIGRDFAGVVERVGSDASRYRVGDEVMGFVSKPILHEGTWADYVVVPEDGYLVPKPPSLDFTQAGALPLAGVTALDAVDSVAPIEGESLLVVGASGGVGSFAVQLAAGSGARVIATARAGDEERLRALGAIETIDFTTEDVATAVRQHHPEGIDALIDSVSWSPTWADALAELTQVVREGGRVVSTIGAARPEELSARGIVGTNVMPTHPELLGRVAELAGKGELTAPIQAAYPLAEAPAALEQFSAGKRGKIVIAIAQP